MPGEALLDTDILSEALKGRDIRVATRASAYLSAYGRLTTSAVSVMEVVRGLEQAGHASRLATFLSRVAGMEVLPLDAASGELAGRIAANLRRRGQTIGPVDPMIAAIAIRHGLTLATGNTAHFGRISAIGFPLAIEDWRLP